MSAPDETGQWAAAEVAELTGLPAYGTAEWLELEPDDGRRLAALILAAEQWRTNQKGPRP